MAPQNEHVDETPYLFSNSYSSKLAANDQVEVTAVEISYGVGGSVHPALVLRVE
jgi:hypothetical protein